MYGKEWQDVTGNSNILFYCIEYSHVMAEVGKYPTR